MTSEQALVLAHAKRLEQLGCAQTKLEKLEKVYQSLADLQRKSFWFCAQCPYCELWFLKDDLVHFQYVFEGIPCESCFWHENKVSCSKCGIEKSINDMHAENNDGRTPIDTVDFRRPLCCTLCATQ